MTELGELGLSNYEEKVYRALLSSGAATAAELTSSSGVPRGRIYDVLNSLEARKLIQKQSTSPNQYNAVNPGTVVERLLAERTRELVQEWEHYQKKAEAVHSNPIPTPPTESRFWLGGLGSEEMILALDQHMRSAENSVHATIGPPYENATWETLQAEFETFFDGASEDITVDLLFSEEAITVLPDTFPQLMNGYSTDITIRTLSDVVLSFDIIDVVETAIEIPHPLSRDDRLGVVGIKDSQVVEEFEQHFQRLWTSADPIFE